MVAFLRLACAILRLVVVEVRSREARNEMANDEEDVADSPMDVLAIVQDLGGREERRVAGRRAFPDVKSQVPIAGVPSAVPLVVGMDGILEARRHLLHISCIAHWETWRMRV